MVYWRKWLATILAALTAFYGVGPVVASHFCQSAQTRDVGLWGADKCSRRVCCKHSSEKPKHGFKKSYCCEEAAEIYQLEVKQTARKFSLPAPPPLIIPSILFLAPSAPPSPGNFILPRSSAPPFPHRLLYTSPPFLQIFRF